jgi:hypothetical protein
MRWRCDNGKTQYGNHGNDDRYRTRSYSPFGKDISLQGLHSIRPNLSTNFRFSFPVPDTIHRSSDSSA